MCGSRYAYIPTAVGTAEAGPGSCADCRALSGALELVAILTYYHVQSSETGAALICYLRIRRDPRNLLTASVSPRSIIQKTHRFGPPDEAASGGSV